MGHELKNLSILKSYYFFFKFFSETNEINEIPEMRITTEETEVEKKIKIFFDKFFFFFKKICQIGVLNGK